jgi:beta-lactamase class A
MPKTQELSRIIEEAESTGGTLGVAVSSSDGWEFQHNGDRRFRSASTVKIPIMIEIFRRIDRGEITLADEFVVTAKDHSVGSGVLHFLHDGLAVTIHDLVYLMMSISDNTATNILIDMVSMDQVNALMHELGMTQSTLGRKMQGRPAEGKQAENWATPADYASLIRKLFDHDVASPESCEQMIAILEKQQNARRIGRYMPEGGVRWGSKTGSIRGVVNDVGFVTTDRGTVIVSVFCEDLPDMHVGEKVIGDIARQAVYIAGIAEPLFTS